MTIAAKSKKYRKDIGFTSKAKCFAWLSGKDIILINWKLIDLYNERLIDIGKRAQNQLIFENNLDVEDFVLQSFQIIKSNKIIEKNFKNHGRANEIVYRDWMLGYLAEKMFSPLIQQELGMDSVVRTGGDDLTNPELFKRISAPDLIDPVKNISVDVQCGVKEGKLTIKKSKVDYAINNGYNGYAVSIGWGTGLYSVVNLNALEHEEFKPNSSWEGALCWTAPDNIFKSWSK